MSGAESHDVIVVGGGPAGAVMAWALAARGIRVAVVERARFPREKVCGDFVEPGGLRILDAMNSLRTLERQAPLPITHACVFVQSSVAFRGAIPYYQAQHGLPPHGYVVPRSELDSVLLQRAQVASATIYEGCSANHIRHDGREAQVGVLSGQRRFVLRAPLIVGADGVESTVARSVGLTHRDPRHAVVGAGIAGLTAALRLAQRGYEVTLYEAKATLGGNLSSTLINGVYHDVYPHMFCEWYKNFWTIFENDLGLSREEHFRPEMSIKLLRKGELEYVELKNSADMASIWRNLRSGFQPFPDMFLYGYAMLDLVAHEFNPVHLLNRNTIIGFLYSKCYTSERSAEMFDFYIREIWSINSSRTSVSAYQKFAKHTLRLSGSMPFAWLLKGSLQAKLIAPLEGKLHQLGCKIRLEHAVSKVDLLPHGKIRLDVARAGGSSAMACDHDYLILAVPPEGLGRLVNSGEDGYCLPREHVALKDSSGDLTFLDISELWEDDPNMRDRTALILAASDFYALPAQDQHVNEDGYLMIKTLHDYLPHFFNRGARWGDTDSDIDWEKTSFRTNLDYKLYINEVDNSTWCPRTEYESLPNVFFAGDFCDNPIAMASVEGAVLGGLQAAQSLWQRHPRGAPVEIAALDTVSQRVFIALKLALGPSAYWAKAWSLTLEAAPKIAAGDFSAVPKTLAMLLRLPSGAAGEFLNTAYSLVDSVVAKRLRRRSR